MNEELRQFAQAIVDNILALRGHYVNGNTRDALLAVAEAISKATNEAMNGPPAR